ncbi:24-hydroxycholesterol 7-alpha-hydroxylase-like isoform X2 [Oscarella lobularis]|uniref:24-hydroxycholesterol 7-alpha-hydroxylase-like isoform X2 n=1 Tax=Oscarella lobularis TaxID=121494 RepID=UPI0033140867
MMLYAAVVICLCFYLLYRNFGKHPNEPPWYPYWTPWLGCAIKFGEAPLHFIDLARKKLGATFSVLVAGKRMTFVTDPDDYGIYFQSPQSDFQQAIQPFLEKAAGISASSYARHHKQIHDAVKGRLSRIQLSRFCETLAQSFRQKFLELGQGGEADLMKTIRNVLFVSTVPLLFGKETLPEDELDAEKFQDAFVKFDEDFEYGAELPSIFVRQLVKCKKILIDKFTSVVNQLYRKGLSQSSSSSDKTVLESFVSAVDRENAPRYALLLLWASQVNAIPATFWTVAFILQNDEIHQKVVQEALDVLDDDSGFSSGTLSEEAIKKLTFTRKCVLEAIRLRSPGAVFRKAVGPLKLKNYTIPSGHFIMLSPYWSHRNPLFFPDPETFNPSRWDKAELEKNLFLEGFVAFGRGRFQCPGRWFAVMEIQIAVAIFFRLFHLELLDPVPQPSPLHLTGTQQPMKPCSIRFHVRT